MTAIAQFREARDAFGQGRYALWTGDVGLAIYLWIACQRNRASRRSRYFETPGPDHPSLNVYPRSRCRSHAAITEIEICGLRTIDNLSRRFST